MNKQVFVHAPHSISNLHLYSGLMSSLVAHERETRSWVTYMNTQNEISGHILYVNTMCSKDNGTSIKPMWL